MPHPDKKNSASESNYLAILGHQVLRLFENIKSLILQTLSVDFLSDSFLRLLLYRTGYIIIVRSCWGFFKQGGCIGPRMFNWESNPAYAIPPLLYSLYHQCCSASQSTGVAKNQNINSNKTTQNKTKKPQTKQIKIKKKKNQNPNQKPQHTLYHFTSKPREDCKHCCIPDVSLHFHFEVYMLQHSVFYPSERLNCNELLGAFAPLLACLNRKHWIDTNPLFWLRDLLETPVPASLWKATRARSQQAAQIPVQIILRADTRYKNCISKSKHAPSSCP